MAIELFDGAIVKTKEGYTMDPLRVCADSRYYRVEFSDVMWTAYGTGVCTPDKYEVVEVLNPEASITTLYDDFIGNTLKSGAVYHTETDTVLVVGVKEVDMWYYSYNSSEGLFPIYKMSCDMQKSFQRKRG